DHARLPGDGHEAGDDRHLDAGVLAALAEVVEVAVLEEELGADIVSPGIHLLLEVVHLFQAVRRGGGALGAGRDAEAQAARAGWAVCSVMNATRASACWKASFDRSKFTRLAGGSPPRARMFSMPDAA